MAETPESTPNDENDENRNEANLAGGNGDPPTANPEENDDEGGSLAWVAATVIALAGWGLCLALSWKLAGLMFAVVLISIVIKEACDPFADAAQWVGDTFHIPGSVRGATLDAIASSMPELFSGIFFVVVAMSAISTLDSEGVERSAEDVVSEQEIAGAKGYGSTIATCAGSAIYNMILIPAFCAIFISFSRPKRPTIDVEDEVIARDGLWFVSCEIILILFLFNNQMHWWMAAAFLGLYVVYILQLFRDAKVYRQQMQLVMGRLQTVGVEARTHDVVAGFEEEGVRVTHTLVDKARDRIRGEDEDEEEEAPDNAGALFGYWNIPLSGLSATLILLICTGFAAGACYFLVEITYETAELLQVPAFFVAVIIAAAASSVPDTLLSIGSAKRGDDSGAVSNAFGSNIFDICICLSIPLLVNSFLNGWQPVSLLRQNGEPIEGLVGLRILLVVLTVITLAIIWHNRQLSRNKAFVLCGLYLIFIAYAVLGSLGVIF